MWNKKCWVFKVDSEKEEAPRIKIQTFVGHGSASQNFRKGLVYVLQTTVKPLTV